MTHGRQICQQCAEEVDIDALIARVWRHDSKKSLDPRHVHFFVIGVGEVLAIDIKRRAEW